MAAECVSGSAGVSKGCAGLILFGMFSIGGSCGCGGRRAARGRPPLTAFDLGKNDEYEN